MHNSFVTLDFLYAAEWVDLAYWSARGSGLGTLHQRQFGRAIAILDTNDPSEHLNRVFFANTIDPMLIDEILAWYRVWGRAPRFDVMPQPDRSEEIMRAMARRGFYQAYFKSVMVAPDIHLKPFNHRTDVHFELLTPDYATMAADVYAYAFGFSPRNEPIRYHSFMNMLDLPNARCFGAWVGNILAGVAILFLAEGAGYMATAATSPQFRGRGIQTAMLYHRMEAAQAMGATWLAGHTESYSISQRNMQRAGMLVGCTKAIWKQLP